MSNGGNVPGLARLASRTGETIEITCSAVFRADAGGGSSNWRITAEGLRVTLTVPPSGRTLPSFIIAQMFTTVGAGQSIQFIGETMLQNPGGRSYSGTFPALIIRSGGSGQSADYVQRFEFTPHCAGSLVDPVNGTARFQTNLFFATRFATTPHGMWRSL
jgi:hypothetical protein